MCLALPARVVALCDGDQAVVELGGVRKQVSLALVDGIAVGDYVIVHVGFALTRLDPAEAEQTLRTFGDYVIVHVGFALTRLDPAEAEQTLRTFAEAGWPATADAAATPQ